MDELTNLDIMYTFPLFVLRPAVNQLSTSTFYNPSGQPAGGSVIHTGLINTKIRRGAWRPSCFPTRLGELRRASANLRCQDQPVLESLESLVDWFNML